MVRRRMAAHIGIAAVCVLSACGGDAADTADDLIEDTVSAPAGNLPATPVRGVRFGQASTPATSVTANGQILYARTIIEEVTDTSVKVYGLGFVLENGQFNKSHTVEGRLEAVG